MKTVYKPWGREEWLELNDKYCYKRIYINAGYKTSYQYHLQKRETNFLISGEAEIWLENDEGIVEKKIIKAGEYFNVTPPKKHRVVALTDIILQEVSTPEVDDVIRIEDDTNRKDGKIEGEHKTPAVLILAAGEGSRLGKLTKDINKALIPINNKAIISYIIEQFPIEYELVVALGYKGDSLKEYCEIAHPDRKFQFVEINDYGRGPGYSAIKCEEHLQRPFYLTTADCILKDKVPYLDNNWMGVFPTGYPEKYSTADIDEFGNIQHFSNKINKEYGYDNAFIGVAGIVDYEIFWDQLKNNGWSSDEVVSAFMNIKKYQLFKAKKLEWLDTGNLDDLNTAKTYFKDKPLSLYKETSEITYKINDKFLKFNSDQQITKNKGERAKHIIYLIPENFGFKKNFIYYSWKDGKTLYEYDSLELYKKFINTLPYFIEKGKHNSDLIHKFYIEKTKQRKDLFISKFGKKYYEEGFNINGKDFISLKSIFKGLPSDNLNSNPFYSSFHGDLQFDNIIYNHEEDKFTYIDWRESFAGDTTQGDLYYDIAKLYGGCLIPYNLMKDDSKSDYFENEFNVSFKTPQTDILRKFLPIYEKFIQEDLKLDLEKVKFITGLIFLNMSPLHNEKFGKILWFKSIEILNGYKQGH